MIGITENLQAWQWISFSVSSGIDCPVRIWTYQLAVKFHLTPHPKFKRGCHLKWEMFLEERKRLFLYGLARVEAATASTEGSKPAILQKQTSQILWLPNVSNSFSAPKLIFFPLSFRQRAPRGTESLRGRLAQLGEVPLECQSQRLQLVTPQFVNHNWVFYSLLVFFWALLFNLPGISYMSTASCDIVKFSFVFLWVKFMVKSFLHSPRKCSSLESLSYLPDR